MKLLTSVAIIEKIHTELTTPLLAASAAPIISAAYHKNMPTIAPPAGASASLCVECAPNPPWFAFMSLLFHTTMLGTLDTKYNFSSSTSANTDRNYATSSAMWATVKQSEQQSAMVLCTIGLTRLLIIRNASCRSINPRPFNDICCVTKSNNKAGKKQQYIIHPVPRNENTIFVVFSNENWVLAMPFGSPMVIIIMCCSGVVWMWHGMFRLQHCEKAANESISVISILFEQAIEKCELQWREMTEKSLKIAGCLFGLDVSCGSIAYDMPTQINIITDAFEDGNVTLFYLQILYAYFAKKRRSKITMGKVSENCPTLLIQLPWLSSFLFSSFPLPPLLFSLLSFSAAFLCSGLRPDQKYPQP